MSASGSRSVKQKEEEKPAYQMSASGSRSVNQEEEKSAYQPEEHINLKVKGQYGNEASYMIRRSTQLQKLMNAYCERQSLDINSIAFLFDGRKLQAEQTPNQLEMEDGDQIDAMQHETGGGLQFV